jgi:translation initiation factor 2 subunit 1
MTTSTPEKQDGLKALNQAINKIEEVITSMGGVFTIQMAVSRVAVRSAHFGYSFT